MEIDSFKKPDKKSTSNRIYAMQPTKLIVLSFIMLIIAGTLLLMLPISSKESGTTLVQALFTATSAVCVTGLVVVDTYQHWSTFGQIVIISLIQIGGLGLITLATFLTAILGKKMRIKNMVLVQESMNFFSLDGIRQLIKKIVLFTLSVEAIGALLLSTVFVGQYGTKGFYIGAFHAISAFCNAGFDLMSISGKGHFLSLIYYNNIPVVIYTVTSLIVIGGLGFVVWDDIFAYRKKKALMLHTKLVLIITGILIISGSILIYIFEYSNPHTLGNLNAFGKVNASVFHSITTRTAGFNTIDLGNMTDISKLLTIFLMFIGAAPGSTGGGVKITTVGVLIITIISQLKGSEDIIVFKKKVPFSIVSRALAIIGFSLMLILIVSTIILVIENKPIIDVIYEVTSAFGTVGLTTGLTPNLHNISKFLLVFMMFIGRVGPLSFALSLTMRSHKNESGIIYPEGKIFVG